MAIVSASQVKGAVKGAMAKTPYRTHRLLPTMVPGAAHAVRAADSARRKRAPVQTTTSLATALPPAEIEHHAPCPLCGNDGVRIRYQTHYGGGDDRGHYHVGQCESCDLLYRVPAIRPERVPDLYTKGDYSEFVEGDYARFRQHLYRTVLATFSPLLDDGAGRSLLDFGCGTGLFLEVAQERGFDVHGVDLAPDSVELARERFGHERVAGEPAALGPGTPDHFDVVTMWSVLAHIAEPYEQIRELYELLAPGGQLLIYTVNADSLERFAFGGKWNGFTRNHLIFWDVKNLRRLLTDVGFSTVEQRHFYGIPRDDPALSRRLTDRHYRATEQWNGGNMLHVIATR